MPPRPKPDRVDPRRKYPWDTWFEEECGFRLKPGDPKTNPRGHRYDCSPESIKQQVRQQASARGYSVSIEERGEGVITVLTKPVERRPPTSLPSPRKESQGYTQRYLGIDPGSSGGMVALDEDGAVLSIHHLAGSDREIWDWLQEYGGEGSFCYLERVHAMPGDGVASLSKFMVNLGKLIMGLVGSETAYQEVTPVKWQRAIGVTARGKTESKTQYKNRLKQKAQQLFPSVKMTHAKADALLIAEYGRRSRLKLI